MEFIEAMGVVDGRVFSFSGLCLGRERSTELNL